MKLYHTRKSEEMFKRTQKSFAGGVGSAARSVGWGFSPYPPFMERGEGSRIYDVDGNEYIDYLCAFGPLMLGHRPKKIIDAVKDVLDTQGSLFGMPHRLEYEVTELLTESVPCLELVRLTNSGAEAIMCVLRLSRAYTGKEKVIKFEGHYHGVTDPIHFSTLPPLAVAGPESAPRSVPATLGIPACLSDTLIVQPWNNPEVLEKTIRNRGHEIAAIIAEPVMGNCGCIPPNEGYLEFLRDITRKNDILLIFDEVITSFRLSLGGAQAYYSVTPDLAVFGKALGCGFPIAGFGGKRDIMELIATNKVAHSGTYNANLLVMAAAKAVLTELKNNKGLYEHLFKMGNAIQKGVVEKIKDAGVSVIAQGVGPMFQILFSDRPITNYREAAQFVRPNQYHAFYQSMLKRGVLFHPSQFENWFVSAAHNEEDIELTLKRVEDGIIEAKKNF
ncbi:aspartate aminotransferase family protein [Chloroflexota bacterium]